MAFSTRRFEFICKRIIILLQFCDIVIAMHVTNNAKQTTAKDTTPTVTISQGTLIGSKMYTKRGKEYFAFIGIPYAKPPVRELRFKSPQPPEPWDGVRDARTVSKNQVCSQIDLNTKQVISSEDCLYLNVYTPKLASDSSKLPIMVFGNNGGSFLNNGNGVIGAEAEPNFLLDEYDDIIVVLVSYRLGVLGFIAEKNEPASGNMGLQDQTQALNWVQQNIDEFGGDRNNVTIFGVDSGAALTLTQQSRTMQEQHGPGKI